jgi:DNA-binding GntR family transcriptional regulator
MRSFDPNDSRSPYEQVAEAIWAAIADGEFPPGGKLPSRAALVAHFGVSPMTIQNAVGVLRVKGVVVSRKGAGVYVHTEAPARVDLLAEVAVLRERVARLERHLNLGKEET